MTDSIRDQIFLLTPFIKDLEQLAATKKDKNMQAVVQNALKALEYQDIEPSIELLITYIDDKNQSVQSTCIQAYQDLFTSKQFDFFLSANHSHLLLKSLINIISTVKVKLQIFTDACQCLNYFVLSTNQQLYIHNSEIDFLLSQLLGIHCKQATEASRKSIEAILKRFLHNLESMAARSTEKVDDYICSDIKTSTDSLIKAIQNENMTPDTAKLILFLLNSIVFEAAPLFTQSEAYQHILIVEIPQLFIQYALASPESVFPSILDFFAKFVSIGHSVIVSFPTIIDQMITPALEEQKTEKCLRALQMLSIFCDFDDPYLISVFAISDCNPHEVKRVFENTFQAVSKMAMDNVATPAKVNACLSFLTKSLTSFKKFFIASTQTKDFQTEQTKSELDQMDEERQVLDQKMTIESCAKQFNQNYKQGIQLIIHSHLADNSPSSIASFIKNQQQLLDPLVVSEYLSRPENVETLNEYVKTFDFTKMAIDNALRALCSQFRLPGESQQIDRVMQAFATKYHIDNPSLMGEDAAYAISFSIMMLHTDIHNPNVTKKITCDEWISNTRNVKEACEVDISVLREIYNRILAKPMKDITLNPYSDSSKLIRRGKKQLQKLMSDSQISQNEVKITIEILLLAFDRLWSTLFATFSLCMQGIQDDTTANLAINGQGKMVFLLSHFSMTKELETVICFMSAFCTSAENDQRRCSGLEALFDIINENSNFFGDNAWIPILELFSNLMRNRSPIEITKPVDSEVQVTNADLISNLPIEGIEKIYSNTIYLDRFSFNSFLMCICRVSTAEIFMNHPSLYSFKKIVDIAILNMNRVRFVWSQAWSILNSHFCRIGCLSHKQISMYVIQQLAKVVSVVAGINTKRLPQLSSSNLLEIDSASQDQLQDIDSNPKESSQDENGNDTSLHNENDGIENTVSSENISISDKWQHFQCEIFSPFCTIFLNQTLYEPRNLVIVILNRIISKLEDPNNQVYKITTAWDVLLDIFEIAASDKSPEIVKTSFSILERNLGGIPDKQAYSTKTAIDLIKFSMQNVVPDIKLSAMSFSISLALKVNPITPSFLHLVQSDLTINSENIINEKQVHGLRKSTVNEAMIQLSSISREVMSIAANLYFMLVLQYYKSMENENWESVENMYILPLFSTPKKELQVQLMQEVFKTLLPSAGEKALSLIPKISMMFMEINEGELLEPLTREIVTLAGSEMYSRNEKKDENSDLIQKISIQTLEKIFNSAAVKPEMILTLYNRIQPKLAFFDVILFCINQSMNLQSISLVKTGVDTLFIVCNQFIFNVENTDNLKLNEEYKNRAAEMIISVLIFTNSQVSKTAVDLLKSIKCELMKIGLRCFENKKIEFQRSIFQFFLNDSREMREIAKEMAEHSQKLFV